MRTVEFGFPGPLRDALVGAILRGEKTSTSSLAMEYSADDPVADIGERELVIDSAGHGVAVIEWTEACTVPLSKVDDEHARAEGEAYTDAAGWRAEHERFWHSEEYREAIGDPEFTVSDATPVVLQRFRLVERVHEH